MAEGPLPTKAEGRAFLTHRCPVANGRGCHVCSFTGYATVGFRFLEAMAERRRAAEPAVIPTVIPPEPQVIPPGRGIIPAPGPVTQPSLFD